MYIDGFAKVNNTSLYYEMTGEGDVIVLIHSGLTDLRQWDGQSDTLGKHFRVIRYDIRGFGKSNRPKNHFHILKI